MSAADHRKSANGIVIAAAGIVLLILYFLSAGPASWLYDRWEQAHGAPPAWVTIGVQTAYLQVIYPAVEGPDWLATPIVAYLSWWTR